jgi:hypothetical protein
MEVSKVQEVTTTLVLNAEEAEWLKAIMQNPMFVRLPQDEDPRDRKLRAIFWTALGGK